MFNPIIVHSENDYDKESKKYKLELQLTFNNFNLYRPQIHENNGATKIMMPQEARERNFTYSSNMTIDMNIKIITRSGENLNEQKLFIKNSKHHNW